MSVDTPVNGSREVDCRPLSGRVVVITGGAGLLSGHWARALLASGARVVLQDVRESELRRRADELRLGGYKNIQTQTVDVTSPESVSAATSQVIEELGVADVLINNASRNPSVGDKGSLKGPPRFETTSLEAWRDALEVGLTGAFLSSQSWGPHMAERGHGLVINVCSDLALISPDQRLYAVGGAADRGQPTKPVAYVVEKAGLLGLTRYLATYWPGRLRSVALVLGGVRSGQPEAFLERVSTRIPLGRLADADEYSGAVVFLCSNAASYMNGSTLILDGGRTTW